MTTLAAISIIPALVSLGFDYLLKETKFGEMKYKNQQIIIGLVFGLLAILFTEVGIDIDSAVINIRDSAPICAGLLFGGPAGIIAGMIGGIYRWFCVFWGGGTFTQVACSIAVIIAGFLAFGARKYLFKNERPNFGLSAGIGVGMEIIHMMLILMTNVDNMSQAFKFVNTCAIVMISCNAFACALAAFAVGKKTLITEKPYPLVHMFAIGLLACFLVLFGISFGVTYVVTIAIQDATNEELLSLNLDDVISTIEELGITKNVNTWRVGKSGGVVITDKEGNLLSASRNGQIVDLNYLDMTVEKDLKPDTFYLTTINNEQVYCEYRETDEYYTFAYMTVTEADLSSYITYYMMLFTETLIYITIFFLVYQIVKRNMIDKLKVVNDGLAEITKGNLDMTFDVRDSREFNELSNDINLTVGTLKDHIKDAEKRNERELEMAHQIQQSAVPFIFPPFPKRKDIDIYALMNTAKEVGGDFYDFYFIDEQHFAFLIADVSGKGIPAAMFMMAAKTLINSLAEGGKKLEEVFSETNEKLSEGNDAGMFLTAWMGCINLENGGVSFVNAGHCPPLICKKDGTFEFIKEKPNFILAGMEGTNYVRHKVYMNPGDTIYLYTDGVTEAENNEHKLYGEDRLAKILTKAKDYVPMDICHIVEDDVTKFAEGAPQSDDITMLAFRINYLSGPNSICVIPNHEAIELVTQYVDKQLAKFNVSASVRNKVQISVDEIFSNIVKYGSATRTEIKFGFEEEKLAITFIDNGIQFDPTIQKAPDVTLSAEERQIGGLGIFLVKQLSSSYKYEYKDGNNCLSVVFNLKDTRKKV